MDYTFEDNLAWPKQDIGIYEIFCKANGKSYVGKTHNRDGFSARWLHHRADLRGNRHSCQHLQNAYNKYGEESFVFRLLEICERTDNLKIKERDWMLRLNVKSNGFNIRGYEEDTPDEAMWKRVPFEFIDPNGDVVGGDDLQAFAKKLGFLYTGFRQVLLGKEWSYKGYTSTSPDFRKPIVEKRVVSPDGELFVFSESLNSFCKKKKLDSKSLANVLNGKSSHHKGWTVENPSSETQKSLESYFKYKIPFSYTNEDGELISGDNLSEHASLNGLTGGEFYKKYIRKRKRAKNGEAKKKTPKEATPPLSGQLISPLGKLIEFDNVVTFAKENNLWLGGVYRTLQGKQNSVMGWTSDKTNPEKLPKKRIIEQVDPNTKAVIKIWLTISEASKELPHNGNFLTNFNAISLRCKDGSELPYKGFIWRYYRESL